MTLIAASCNSDSSSVVLAADIMISSSQKRQTAIHMPLSGWISAKASEPSEYYIAGVKKKCHLISDRCAVAWAGQIVMATAIIRRAISNNVSPADMQAAIMTNINEYELRDRSSVSFIGLSIHDRIKSVNKFPLQLFAVGSGVEYFEPNGFLAVYSGSGSTHFKESFFKYSGIFHKNDLHDRFSGIVLPNLPLIESILEVQHREVISGPDVKNYFGGGFNIIGTDRKNGDVVLRSTSGVCYLFGDINLNLIDRRLELYIRSPVVHVEEAGDDTIFIVDNIETTELKRTMNIIRSDIGERKHYDSSVIEKYDDESKPEFVIMYASVNINNGESKSHVSVVDPNERWFKVCKEKRRLSIDVFMEKFTNSFTKGYFR